MLTETKIIIWKACRGTFWNIFD